MDACADYLEAKGRRLSFEWALIDGVNDRDVDADEPGRAGPRLPLPAHVNLIPLNPTPGLRGAGHADAHGCGRSATACATGGVNATVRRTRGTDIDAACGQLRATHEASEPVAIRRSRPDRPRAARRRQRTRTVSGSPASDGAASATRPAGPTAPGHTTHRSTRAVRRSAPVADHARRRRSPPGWPPGSRAGVPQSTNGAVVAHDVEPPVGLGRPPRHLVEARRLGGAARRRRPTA